MLSAAFYCLYVGCICVIRWHCFVMSVTNMSIELTSFDMYLHEFYELRLVALSGVSLFVNTLDTSWGGARNLSSVVEQC